MTDREQFETLEEVSDSFKQDGALTTPAIPATTVPLKNPFPFPVWVRITGGTVTVVAVDGTTITGMVTASLANGDWIRLRANSTVTLTYSVVPTSWQWFQE
jgi:hypothetical protein